MSAFMCICNPVKVWDFRAWWATDPADGYWVFPRTVFDKAAPGDRLYLRVTSNDRFPGLHARFLVTGKKTATCPTDFWIEGKHPEGLQFIVNFGIDRWFSKSRITPEDLLMAGIGKGSRLLRVPQQMACEIDEAEADIIDGILERRRLL